MHSKAKFANARTVAVIQRLLEQLGKAGAIFGRAGDSLVLSASKSAGIVGENWNALLEYQLHSECLHASYAVFVGVERYNDTVILELGALTGMQPHADIPGAEQLRRAIAELPVLRKKEHARCA
ncbi:MAG: hypothetical protein A2286_05745 [Gammaproteobacteria bacterium RIFOXYA12_FULL_61_12]|nr:MAG: hypothetical protein A2514_10105 [Gammaproteobacteria bacterium RIFOXYD12_FULL_61_37]OGT92486.1 MAG: hypothetical protein A2286_05745 [Gammaproteobacteria bacterium RIFOXYA12_FULL_61_12]